MWLQLLAELRALGAVVVRADFNKLTIATDKAGLAEAEAYVDFVLASLKRRQLFHWVQLTPEKYWSSLVYVDPFNFGGIEHRQEWEDELEESLPTQLVDDVDGSDSNGEVDYPDDEDESDDEERYGYRPH